MTETSLTLKPLSGVRVLELGRLIAAPFCAQLLADLGAEVIKVERPGRGDEGRHYGPPFLKDAEGKDTADSAMSLTFNRNKQSMTLDFGDPRGRDILMRLAAQSDVFIENYRPGVLQRYGLDVASLRELKPDLIYLSVTGFGSTGPYANRAATDIIVQGMSGLMSVTGDGGGPQKVGVAVMDMFTGLYAAVGVLAALRHKEVNRGGGQAIGTALLDAGLAVMATRMIELSLQDGAVEAAPRPAPSALFPCIGGVLNVQASGDRDFLSLCSILDRPDLIEDDRYGSRADRARHGDQLHEALRPTFATWRYDELYEALTARSIMCGPVYDVAAAFGDPHVQARRMKVVAPHPVAGETAMVRSPLEFSVTPVTDYAPPPMLGEHTREILGRRLGLEGSAIDELERNGIV